MKVKKHYEQDHVILYVTEATSRPPSPSTATAR